MSRLLLDGLNISVHDLWIARLAEGTIHSEKLLKQCKRKSSFPVTAQIEQNTTHITFWRSMTADIKAKISTTLSVVASELDLSLHIIGLGRNSMIWSRNPIVLNNCSAFQKF